jgi:hypothetical protein
MAMALQQTGEGGTGGGGGLALPQNAPQVPIVPTANVKSMGTVLQTFNGDRIQARDFIEEL